MKASLTSLREVVSKSKAPKRRKVMANIVLDLQYAVVEDDIRYILNPEVPEIHAENRMIKLRKEAV